MNDGRDPSSPAPDPLDDWLAEARWPEPTAMSTTRLEARWRDLNRPRRTMRWAMALAASVLIAAMVWMQWPTRSGHGEQTVVAAPAPLPGREPTRLEVTLFAARERNAARKKLAASRPIVASQTPTPPVRVQPAPSIALRPYLERVADEQTRADALAELDRMKSPPTEQLLGFFTDSRADLRVAAALALGRIDGPVLTRRLIEMIERDQSRREAFIALASSRGRDARLYVRGAAASEQYASLARSAMIASEIQ
jgi:hypothetical protein